MHGKLKALSDNHNWTLVLWEPHMHVIGCKCAFKAKLNANSSFNCLKARLAIKCFNQVDGGNYSKTFSPVIKPTTIHTIISLALLRHSSIY